MSDIKKNIVGKAQEYVWKELMRLDTSHEKAQKEWRRIAGKNMHWMEGGVEKGLPLNSIYKIDLHECPNFYHLNIKIAKDQRQEGQVPSQELAGDHPDSEVCLKTQLHRC